MSVFPPQADVLWKDRANWTPTLPSVHCTHYKTLFKKECGYLHETTAYHPGALSPNSELIWFLHFRQARPPSQVCHTATIVYNTQWLQSGEGISCDSRDLYFTAAALKHRNPSEGSDCNSSIRFSRHGRPDELYQYCAHSGAYGLRTGLATLQLVSCHVLNLM